MWHMHVSARARAVHMHERAREGGRGRGRGLRFSLTQVDVVLKDALPVEPLTCIRRLVWAQYRGDV